MPVAPATRVRDYGKLEEISALACRNLLPGVPGNGAGHEFCRATIDTTAYFDQIQHRPDSQPVDAGAMERLSEWARERWANGATFARPEYAPEAAAKDR